MTKYYINVLRLENYNTDLDSELKELAIPLNKVKLAREMEVGDFVVTYVSSRISAFASVRNVIDTTITKRRRFNYDVPIEGVIGTNAILKLGQQDWINARTLINQLTFINHKKYWMNYFLNSLIEIPEVDFNLIMEKMSVQ